MTKKGVVKIVDFGMSVHLHTKTEIKKTEKAGKYGYMAPEMKSSDPYNA